jgi:membrane protein DedA with SNARE-associated domain
MSAFYGALGVLVIIVLPGYLAGRVARAKGRQFALYFCAALIVGPLALLIALILPRRRSLS